MKFALLAVGGIFATAILLVAVLLSPPTGAADLGYGAALKEGAVPEAYAAFVETAGQVCTGVDAPLIAAQIHAESDWDPTAVSSAGAQGIAQFMPATWAEWGKDANGNGVAASTEPQDAIAAQADFMCYLHDQSKGLLDANAAIGDPVELALAAYNAGFGAVQNAGGIPINGQTEIYVPKILSLRLTYAEVVSNPRHGP